MVLSAGTVVAGYRIEKVLGSGGMGTVYLAANPVLPRHDALKVLSAELSQDAEFRARFIREADLAATLDHPNIVTVYTRGETEDGQLWIAMQYVAGSDAQNELEEGRMTARRAVYIVGEIGKALDYAHRRKLLHRDVKPANFLLASDGERVFLADFGIARAIDESIGLTTAGKVMATIGYAAPETLGEGRVDGRSDFYSLGCSLYRLLTGQTPFATSGGGMAAVVAAHLSKPPPRVTDHAPWLPQAFDGVIARAMAKDPAARYQSGRELAAAAAAALAGVPTGSARPAAPPGGPTPPPATTPPSGPHPLVPGPPGVDASNPPRRRRGRWLAAAIAAVVLLVAGLVAVGVRGGGSAPGYQPQSFDHVHGTTEIGSQPHAVAAIGPGDAAAVLSLGVQPVALTAPGGRLPGWEQQLVTGQPRVLSGVDTAAIAAAKPDAIIATGDIDDATYTALAAIAPTVTRPHLGTGAAWTWQDRMSWIGRIVGRDDQAKALIAADRTRQDEVRGQHPAFSGKTVEVLNVSDAGVTATLAQSDTTDYLTGLGLQYPASLQRTGSDTGDVRPIADLNVLNQIPTDVLVVVRTDKGAGSGSYNGLPTQLTTYKGATVIVDSADVIAALTTGGYAASGYLNTTFVKDLAQMVH